MLQHALQVAMKAGQQTEHHLVGVFVLAPESAIRDAYLMIARLAQNRLGLSRTDRQLVGNIADALPRP